MLVNVLNKVEYYNDLSLTAVQNEYSFDVLNYVGYNTRIQHSISIPKLHQTTPLQHCALQSKINIQGLFTPVLHVWEFSCMTSQLSVEFVYILKISFLYIFLCNWLFDIWYLNHVDCPRLPASAILSRLLAVQQLSDLTMKHLLALHNKVQQHLSQYSGER